MKDQVPVVLLNQWLGINPEKSAFAKKEWCKAGSEEYSAYSSESMSQKLSIQGKSIKRVQNISKRKSVLVTQASTNSHLVNFATNRQRRMTILNKAFNFAPIDQLSHAVIKEVDDLSSSSDSKSTCSEKLKEDKTKEKKSWIDHKNNLKITVLI